MSLINVEKRLQKLRDLRSDLCKKEKNLKEAFKLKDWVVDQLKELHILAATKDSTKDDIKIMLEAILCVLVPAEDISDDK